jgi:cysteine synthase A
MHQNTVLDTTGISRSPEPLRPSGRGLHGSVLETIGKTPVVRISRLAPVGIDLYVKLESFNPMGSVKDRLAAGIIEAAEREGRLHPGQTVIEASSGNTGISLAMVCARKGYPLVIVMAENFSIERRRLMRYLGARVVLTPADRMGSGMLAKARELAASHGWFLCNQFESEVNADIHFRTTAAEIIADFRDRRLDYWVSGYGTGGTLNGVSRALREARPDTRIVAVEPDNSPLLGSGIRQRHSADDGAYHSHPSFRPHLMQGWTPDFLSRLTEQALNDGLIDRVIPVSGADALKYARLLARREGVFAGISAGATFAGALRLCESAAPGSSILCMLPDTGERYLSTPLFEDIPVEMDATERSIADSTPTCRFDVTAAESAPEATPPNDNAIAFVEETINSPTHPIVMFALEWCEFCWSVRKLFAQCGLDYRSIDLDSVEYQTDDWGGKVRTALNARTGWVTIPQVFIGGEFIGGCTDTFEAFKSGRLMALLDSKGIQGDAPDGLDPYTLLPQWLHPR